LFKQKERKEKILQLKTFFLTHLQSSNKV